MVLQTNDWENMKLKINRFSACNMMLLPITGPEKILT